MVLDLGIGEELQIVEDKYPEKLQRMLKYTFLYSILLHGLMVLSAIFVESPFDPILPIFRDGTQRKTELVNEYSQFQSNMKSFDSLFSGAFFIILKVFWVVYVLFNLTILIYLVSQYVQRYKRTKHELERLMIEENGTHASHFLDENFSLTTALNFRRNGLAFYQLLVLTYFSAFYVVLLFLIMFLVIFYYTYFVIIGLFVFGISGIFIGLLKHYGPNFSLNNISPLINFPLLIALFFFTLIHLSGGAIYRGFEDDFVYVSFLTLPLFVIIVGVVVLRFKQDSYFFINGSDATRWTHNRLGTPCQDLIFEV